MPTLKTQKMTSRQRVLTALQHQEPDKVPIDFGGMRSTGIMAIAYNQLKKQLGMNGGETLVYDVTQQLAFPEKPILDLFEVDVIDLLYPLDPQPQKWKEWTLPDGSPGKLPVDRYPVQLNDEWVFKDGDRVAARMPKGGYYFDSCNPPFKDIHTSAELKQLKWKKYLSEEFLREIERNAKSLHDNTEYAVLGGFGGNLLECGQGCRGWEKFMVDLYENRSFVEDFLDELTELHLANLKSFLQAVGNHIQIIQFGDDLGTQNGPQISARLYREIFKPRHQKLFQYVKQHSQLYVFLHSCGSVYAFLPDLIEAGLDILNPVQTSAKDMDPARLKKEFGQKLTFWGGGCDTQFVLPQSTPAEIDAHVKERVQIFAPGGGYVFNQIHNVQAGIPPENVVALYSAIKKYRNYPIERRNG